MFCELHLVDAVEIGDAVYEVSTVELPFGLGLPYETMVFQDNKGVYTDRYATEEEAMAGHEVVIEALRGGTLEFDEA